MSVKLPSFNTDFTCYLDNQPPHTVKLVTNTEIIECSGVILSQHSQVLREQIRQDTEVFLLDYQYVRELLVLLHGGCVDLTVENCLEFVKFACQFKVEGVVEQVYCFLSSVVDISNVVQCVKVCLGAIKVASFYAEGDLGRDLLWPCEDFVDMMSFEEVVEFVRHFEPDEVFAMFVNKIFVKKLLSVSSGLVIDSNAESVLESLLLNEDFVEAAALCPEPEITTFFEEFKKLNLSVRSLKVLHNLKKSLLKEISLGALILTTSAICITSNGHGEMLKSWQNYSVDQMFGLCKLPLTAEIDNFFFLEIIMSWVSLKRPQLMVVKRLCNAVNPTVLPSSYLQHASAVINELGYEVTLKIEKGTASDTSHPYDSKERLDIKYYRVNYASNTYYWNPTMCIRFECGKHNRKKCISQIVVDKDGVFVHCDPKANPGRPSSGHVVYGTSKGGKHIPFYTDPIAAMKLSSVDETDETEMTIIRLNSYEGPQVPPGRKWLDD